MGRLFSSWPVQIMAYSTDSTELETGHYMKQILVLSLLLSVLGFTLRAEPLTDYGHNFNACQRKYPIVWWSPGIMMFCGELPSAQKSRSQVMAEAKKGCEEAARKWIPASVSYRPKCRLAFDGHRFTDQSFRKILKRYPPIPVRLTIYDHETKKLQKTSGALFYEPSKFLRGARSPFRLEAHGVEICKGYHNNKNKIRYSIECFGQRFTGVSKVEKIYRTGGMQYLTPKAATVKWKKSYITIEFR